ncbi:hypothetical protein F5Y19DRAFT_410653 [Xylariaceae sp. FL1651]|nr:hypothetical protein F5Y19DRAFT_410653 [Xylariaceae sp. FL1651]
MSHPPSTPVKVPPSAATYTPATQDPDLRSQVNTLLLREGHITKIQEHLLHSLDAHNSNWPSAIQSHALALLRSGEVSTFPALIRRVLEDVRRDTAAAAASASSTGHSSSSTTNNNNTSSSSLTSSTNNNTQSSSTTATDKDGGPSVNGAAVTNGTSKSASSINGTGAGAEGTSSLAIPTAVIEAVLKVTRDSLEAVCEIEDGPTGG